MGKAYEPQQDHSKDWLKVGGLGCAYYGIAALLLIAVVALIVIVLRWIL